MRKLLGFASLLLLSAGCQLFTIPKETNDVAAGCGYSKTISLVYNPLVTVRVLLKMRISYAPVVTFAYPAQHIDRLREEQG